MRKKKIGAVCMAAIAGASLAMSMTAVASEDSIAIPYLQEGAWEEIAMTNDDTVSTGVYVRRTASENGQVIGSLYQGGAAWVINKGPEWTEVYSGGLTGFIKNEYLVYGEEASELAQNHGREGVATTWDDVKLFEKGDAGSEVLATIDHGNAFILAEDGGHWLQIQNGADDTVYVSEDDVSRVLILDTAVSNGKAELEDGVEVSGSLESAAYAASDEKAGSGADGYYEESYSEYYEESYEEAYEESFEESVYTESYEESYTDYSAYQETTVVDTVTADSSSQSLPYGIGYYDEYTGTYYDYYGNPVYTGSQILSYYDEYTGDYYDVYGTWMFNIPLSGASSEEMTSPESYQEESYSEESYSDDSYTEDTQEEIYEESSSSGSSDNASLLAALIYCEAGNQSYDGMVAVGAVVMNRVASSSFPNTISDVIYQSGQFTPAYSGALSSALSNGVPSACYDAAVAAMCGENPVGGALYFNTGSGKGMKIGAHQFY